jgi:chromosome partitioning protein
MPLIHSYNPRSKAPVIEPEWIITDSPAGFRDEKLSDAVKQADCVIVPIQPSAFDIGATSDFLDILVEEKAIRKNKTFVALVGMRVNSRTHAAAGLAEFMEQTGFPVLTYLRNAQVYATAAELGVSLFDMRPSLVTQDIQQWVPLLDWIMEATADSG